MNLLKSFSVTTGLDPGNSYLYESLYPLDFDKYIVLDTQSNNPNFHYIFWFRVIELIEPILSNHSIKIVHFVEDKRYHFNHTYLDNSNALSQNHLPSIRFVKTINYIHNGRFSRTIFGYECNFLVFIDAKRNVFKKCFFSK